MSSLWGEVERVVYLVRLAIHGTSLVSLDDHLLDLQWQLRLDLYLQLSGQIRVDQSDSLRVCVGSSDSSLDMVAIHAMELWRWHLRSILLDISLGPSEMHDSSMRQQHDMIIVTQRALLQRQRSIQTSGQK